MKVLFLCAGYGTRLQRDIQNYPDFQHLSNVPKPLLPINGVPLLSVWMDKLKFLDNLEICLVVNDLYFNVFEDWALNYRDFKMKLLNDGTRTNEDRLGAVTCINLALEKCLGYEEEVLVVAGDTLLDKNFDLQSFYNVFRELNANKEVASLVVDTKCTDEEIHKRGIIETDLTGKVISFLEKPSAKETRSRKQSPCFYLIHPHHLKMFPEFLDKFADQPLAARDATGNFLKFLITKGNVFSLSIGKRYDVGGLETYLECCREMSKEEI